MTVGYIGDTLPVDWQSQLAAGAQLDNSGMVYETSIPVVMNGEQAPTPPCMPTGSLGPLQPNQTWCATGTGIPPGNGAPAVTSNSWMILALVAGAIVLIGVKR